MLDDSVFYSVDNLEFLYKTVFVIGFRMETSGLYHLNALIASILKIFGERIWKVSLKAVYACGMKNRILWELLILADRNIFTNEISL